MSGMKNYLVKHGEKGFDKEVERERNKVSCSSVCGLLYLLYCSLVTVHRIFEPRCNTGRCTTQTGHQATKESLAKIICGSL